jgi:hypothetical protein
MPRTAKIIPVPTPAPGSFNKHRRAGTLLRSQLVHLRETLVKHHAEVERLLAISSHELETEAEVADYAKRVTAILHPHKARHQTL